MTYQRALKLCHEIVNNNRRVQQLLDDILDNAVNPEDFGRREDWSQVTKTVELFTYAGIVLEPLGQGSYEWRRPVSADLSGCEGHVQEIPRSGSR